MSGSLCRFSSNFQYDIPLIKFFLKFSRCKLCYFLFWELQILLKFYRHIFYFLLFRYFRHFLDFANVNFVICFFDALKINHIKSFADTEDASETDAAKQETQYTEIKEQ